MAQNTSREASPSSTERKRLVMIWFPLISWLVATSGKSKHPEIRQEKNKILNQLFM